MFRQSIQTEDVQLNIHMCIIYSRGILHQFIDISTYSAWHVASRDIHQRPEFIFKL